MNPIGTSTQLSLDGIELLLDGQQSSTDAIDHLCKVSGPYFARLYIGQRPIDFLATRLDFLGQNFFLFDQVIGFLPQSGVERCSSVTGPIPLGQLDFTASTGHSHLIRSMSQFLRDQHEVFQDLDRVRCADLGRDGRRQR